MSKRNPQSLWHILERFGIIFTDITKLKPAHQSLGEGDPWKKEVPFDFWRNGKGSGRDWRFPFISISLLGKVRADSTF
jgi:hypothetical protein